MENLNQANQTHPNTELQTLDDFDLNQWLKDQIPDQPGTATNGFDSNHLLDEQSAPSVSRAIDQPRKIRNGLYFNQLQDEQAAHAIGNARAQPEPATIHQPLPWEQNTPGRKIQTNIKNTRDQVININIDERKKKNRPLIRRSVASERFPLKRTICQTRQNVTGQTVL